jgi:DNA-binding transcriptional regulator of glucitol operon
VCLGIESPLRQWYEWQNSNNMSVRSWIMDLEEELYNIGLAFVWTKQEKCNLRTITKIVKDKRNDIEKKIF